MARLNLALPTLDQLLDLERRNGLSGAHALEVGSMSTEAQGRWDQVASRWVDDTSVTVHDPVSITYCLELIDSRRVIVLVDAEAGKVYPLWWDTAHAVSGSNGSQAARGTCSGSMCHHGEGAGLPEDAEP